MSTVLSHHSPLPPKPSYSPKPPEPSASSIHASFEQEHLTSSDALSEDSGIRPKRRQVKRACVHCRKACKRCDDKRPCNRCTRYGFTNCVDAARKERKKGIKRGPYKKRDAKGSKPVDGPSQSVQQVFSPESVGCQDLCLSSPPPVSPQSADIKQEPCNHHIFRPSAPPPPSVSAARQRVEQAEMPVPEHLVHHYYAIQQQPNASRIANYEPPSPVSPDGSPDSPTLASPVSPLTPGDRDGYHGVSTTYPNGYNNYHHHHAEATLVQTYTSTGYSGYYDYPCYTPETRLDYHYLPHSYAKPRYVPGLAFHNPC